MPCLSGRVTPELLSPAGNWDCARAAVAAGADAIYFGLEKFNARLRADNFTTADLPELMEYLHRHGVRGFVAMNTLIFTGELEAAERQLREIAAAGVDALIIQDLGLAKLARTVAPDVEIHASTQMTITSPEGLAFVESLVPLERAVLARELSVREIERFQRSDVETHAPLEVFVHGALCVAYSGQCLTSESLGQRSANRGECAQACRMPYELVVDGEVRELGEVRYLLSPQDLAAVDMIPDLVKAGVKSYKIEGRLKSPEYVTAVTRVYRKALDAAVAGLASPVDAADRYAMEMTFSRGLTSGWLAGTNHPYLTHGRFGKKRGPLLGTIGEVGAGWVRLKNRTGIPIAAGDGVVFDAGEDRNREQGGRIWKLEKDHLVFHRTFGGVDFERVRVGQTLYKTSDPKLDSDLRRFWQNAKPQPKRQPVVMTVEGAPGAAMVLTAEVVGEPARSPSQEAGPGVPAPRARVVSPVPLQAADRHALDDASLAAQLGRLGDTCFVLERVENRLQGACHLPLSVLNQMRREVVAALDVPVEKRAKVLPQMGVCDLLPERPVVEVAEPVLSVLCRTDEQLGAAIEAGVSTVYLDYEDPRRYRDAVARFRSEAQAGAEILLATPRILKPGEDGYLKLIERAGPHGMLLRNLAALNYYKNRSEFRRVGDFSLNVANPVTARMLMEGAALDWLTVSYDLNIGQALELLHAAPAGWFELTLHQHMPMFHMEHCVFCVFLSKGTTYKDCGRPCEKHVVHLRDRVGQLHRLQADVGCRNTLFNGRAQTGARFFGALRQSGLRRFRVELLDEDAGTAARTIRSYQDLLAGRAGAEEVLGKVEALEKLGVTEGTLLAKEGLVSSK